MLGNFDIDQADALASNEVDTTLSYTYALKDLSIGNTKLNTINLTVGSIYYEFLSTDTVTKEFFLGVGYDTLLSPTVTWCHDYGKESQGGGDVGLKAAVTVPLTSSLFMAPSVNYSIPLSDLKNTAIGNQQNEFFWGLNFSATF